MRRLSDLVFVRFRVGCTIEPGYSIRAVYRWGDPVRSREHTQWFFWGACVEERIRDYVRDMS